jgi:hypothetical protein
LEFKQALHLQNLNKIKEEEEEEEYRIRMQHNETKF